MPRVTALINTYNHERFIERCLRSVVEQDFPAGEMEATVVDDGSTDGTPEIVRQFEPRVRLIRKENGGQVSAFNVGVAEAKGEMIAFLDGDDWWATNKLAEVVRAFDANPDVAAIGHGYYEVFDTAPAQEMIVPGKTRVLGLSSVAAARLALFGTIFLTTSMLSVRRRVLDQIGVLPQEAIFFDTLVFTLSFALGGALVLDQPLSYYRRHGRNLYNPTSLDEATKQRQLAALSFRLNYLPQRLREFDVSRNLIDALMAYTRVEYERSRLQFGEQSRRWNVFRNEMLRFRSTYKNPSAGYVLFQWAVGACALLLSPRQFRRLLDWYGRNDVKRFRGLLGKAKPRAPEDFARRLPVIPDE